MKLTWNMRAGLAVLAVAMLLIVTSSGSAQRPKADVGVPTATGKVVAYEADKAITVEVNKRGNEVQKLEFAIVKDKTKVELTGATKAIEVGTQVRVWAEKDNPKTAARIAAGVSANPAAPTGQAKGEAMLGGTLQGVDVAKNTVTVVTSNRATGKVEKTYDLAKDVVVLRDGKPAKVSDLKKGGSISVKLSPDQKTAVSISERGKTISAPLKSVDPENNTITLTVSEGGRNPVKKDVTHQLTKDGKVTLAGKEVKLADLKDVRPGSTIQLTFSVDDEKKLIAIQYAPARR